jgi:signal transduction histidine kinase
MAKTPDIFSFINSCEPQTDFDVILIQFAQYLKAEFSDLNVAVLEADTFKGITRSDFTNKIAYRLAGQTLADNSTFKIYNPEREAHYILVVDDPAEENKNQIQTICSQLQSILHIFCPQTDKNVPKCADLISFITHDINSLVTLAKEQKGNTPEFLSKIAYMEKANADLNFYLRELDIALTHIKIIDLTQAMISEISNSEKVHIKTSLSTPDGFIEVDVEHLNRAFQNIIRNAIRAAKLKGGEVSIETKSRKSWIDIIITDNGPGIPFEFVERVKKPFFTTFRAQGHTGFGLSIAEKIIHAHQGLLEVINHTVGGVQAQICLPVERTA